LKKVTTHYESGNKFPPGADETGPLVIKVSGEIAQFAIDEEFGLPAEPQESKKPAKKRGQKGK
jgi:hypothetical protein